MTGFTYNKYWLEKTFRIIANLKVLVVYKIPIQRWKILTVAVTVKIFRQSTQKSNYTQYISHFLRNWVRENKGRIETFSENSNSIYNLIIGSFYFDILL